MNPSVAVITTFSGHGYDQYAHRMVSTFQTNWPKEVRLFLYPDQRLDLPMDERTFSLVNPCLPKNKFLRKWGGEPYYQGRGHDGKTAYNYRFDALKFCHKPFSVWHFATQINLMLTHPVDRLVWLDADTLTHSRIPMGMILDQIAPGGMDVQFLGRSYKYSECGYIAFDLNRDGALKFIQTWVDFYREGTFAKQSEWHDSWLFDCAREALPDLVYNNLTGHIPRESGAGHPFLQTFLGLHMDHLKGETRKSSGRPVKGDLFVDHDAPYWKENAHAKQRHKPAKPS